MSTPVNEFNKQPGRCMQCVYSTWEHMHGQIQRQLVCKRFPPNASMTFVPRGPAGGMAGHTMFPIMQPHQWCWEFKAQAAPLTEVTATVVKDQPSQSLLMALDADRKRGCTCREFVGEALKVEPDCPVHNQLGQETLERGNDNL